MYQTALDQLVLLFEPYAEAVVVADANNTVLYVNPAFTALTGYQCSEVTGKRHTDLLIVRVNYHVNTDRWEARINTKTNGQLWVRVSETRLGEEWDGKIIYTLVENHGLEQLKGLLKESETRFSSLADASPVMIWMTDPDNLCFYLNKAWLEFTGKPLEEQVGVGWLKLVHDEDLNKFNDLNDLLQERRQYSLEYRLLRKDGVYRHIMEIGTPRYLPDGTYAGYMGSCLDITDLKKAQHELANYTAELKRSNEELEQFAYVASHDLQEPLRMISSYIQLIKKNLETGRPPQETFEFMNFVTDAVARMQMLISDLLQFSRLNRKGLPFAPVDLNAVANAAIINLTQRISENNAKITLDNLPTVTGERSQLTRLFQNLIDNAIKFRSPDRIPEVHISVKEDENRYVFCVSDNGIGIEDKHYHRIFVIFQRLHARSEYEGTGIGLAICRKIVELHGGEIWVDSCYGKGSCFYFTLKK
ncbi:MAG: PAS domain S-box protein [Chitinophagales bacterium]|nr:PAS domain S-box protein [Chitinophagales bacterium]